jgi:alkaline phosphatase D
LTWDDHEVANNYAGDVLVEDPSPAAALERRAAAYRAWWEHLPVRVGPPDGPDLAVHQALTIGDLARLHMLDERQYSDTPPCRDAGAAGDYGDCPARTTEDRSILGADQESWLGESLQTGGVAWNLIGNPVVLAGIDGGTDAPAFYLDSWDGFPAAQRRVIEQLAGAENPVVLTGDYHAGMVLDVNAEPFDVASALVAPEFMAPPISSILFPDDVSARTPQLRQQLNNHGYLLVDVEPERLVARFRVLDDVQQADSPIQTAATWQVTAGSPVAEQT